MNISIVKVVLTNLYRQKYLKSVATIAGIAINGEMKIVVRAIKQARTADPRADAFCFSGSEKVIPS
jgi:hypothetical protein